MTALALEDGVFAHPDLDVQVARGPPIAARLALTVQADPVARIDAGRHGDGQGLLLADAALAVTAIAGVADDLAAPLAARTRLLDRENGLLHPYLALPVAGL